MDQFELYLVQKQIDAARFRAALPAEWSRWKSEFDAAGALAFDHSKKFLINPLRLQFPIIATS